MPGKPVTKGKETTYNVYDYSFPIRMERVKYSVVLRLALAFRGRMEARKRGEVPEGFI
jgi:hypothetical protein